MVPIFVVKNPTNHPNSPLLFLATIILALLIMMGESQRIQVPLESPPKEPTKYLEYSIVEGYFQQSDPATDDKNFDYVRSLPPFEKQTLTSFQTKVNFGLVDRPYASDGENPDQGRTQWEKFELEVARLNHESEANVQYKVLFSIPPIPSKLIKHYLTPNSGQTRRRISQPSRSFLRNQKLGRSSPLPTIQFNTKLKENHSATGPSKTETPPQPGRTLTSHP